VCLGVCGDHGVWSLCGRDSRAAGMGCVVPALEWWRENTVAVRDLRLVRAGFSWLLPGQPAQRVQQGAELVSAGQ
jgi:hypothetical protein